jgi:1,4-dihydroxy-2-naphthoate octaprenyltransferase
VTTLYLVAALVAFAAILGGVLAGLLPPFTLLALAVVPLAFRIHQGIRQHYNSPYTLMGVMGDNVSLHLYVGLLLLAGYLIAIVVRLAT